MLRLRSLFVRAPVLVQHITLQPVQPLHVSAVDLKARKGTREKWAKLKKKRKAEKMTDDVKVGYVPRKKGDKMKNVNRHLLNNDQDKDISTDDVFCKEHYQQPAYRIVDAIEAHKQTHQPTMLDALHMPLLVTIEMDMTGEKEVRKVPDFQKLVKLNHSFDHGQQRSILFFSNEQKNWEQAKEAGATEAGGTNLIRAALKGNLRFGDYEYIVAHADIMTELMQLRGLLKRRFPSLKAQTVGTDSQALVRSFIDGILVEGQKDAIQRDFGVVSTTVGTLKMPTDHLADNCLKILSAVNQQRPNRGGRFITRVFFETSLVDERLRIDPKEFPFGDYERPIVQKVVKVSKKKSKQNPNQLPRVFSLFRLPQ